MFSMKGKKERMWEKTEMHAAEVHVEKGTFFIMSSVGE